MSRSRKMVLSLMEMRSVRIRKNAWIGRGSTVMEAVIIGGGAIIGAISVVIANIPLHPIATGNRQRS